MNQVKSEGGQQEESETNHTTENLESVGQIIVGGIEQIGGILTGDPLTRAEGEFNAEVGSLRQESNKNLTAIDDKAKFQHSDAAEDNREISGE